MDIIIPKKKWTLKKIITLAVLIIFIALLVFNYFLFSGEQEINVNSDQIIVSTIKHGKFQEFIPINGIVLPITTIYLDAREGGRVDEIYFEDGVLIKKGDQIMRLSNTDLELTLATQETAVFDVLTQIQNTRNNSQQNTISKLNQMADVDNALKEAERIYRINNQLYNEKVISLQEYKSSENLYDYQVKRKKLIEKILQQDSISAILQMNQMNETFRRMKNTLALMRRKVEDLSVKAPIDGQLTSMDAQIGESKNKGQRLGQIDVLSGFKVRADIDEHYISRIYTGLEGHFNFSNKFYNLKIKKVYAQVNNGKFQVDLEFSGPIPKNIRRGQTLQIKLALSDEVDGILLPKGSFYQQTGGNWIFKLNDKETYAYKVEIQIGRQNPNYFEVIQGLQMGEKVITSSYENYDNIQKLVIKK